MTSNDSGDPFEDPRWLAYADRVRRELAPKVRESAVAVSVFTGEIDPKLAIETGYMVLMDKPIIVSVTPGAKVPRKLAMVADEIVEANPNNPSEAVGRLNAAIARVLKKLGSK